jgi:hypothetical protein
MLAQIWSLSFSDWRPYLFVGAMTTVIAAANLVYTIWPRHSTPNSSLVLAQCFAEHATTQDMVVVTNWNWYGYATYFFNYQGEQLSLIGTAADKPRKIQAVSQGLDQMRQSGGHVYIQDMAAYSPGELAFVESLTAFTPSDLGAFERRPAFGCGEAKFDLIVGVR